MNFVMSFVGFSSVMSRFCNLKGLSERMNQKKFWRQEADCSLLYGNIRAGLARVRSLLILVAAIIFCEQVHADSISISETWKDVTSIVSADTGTFNASITVPGLQNFTATQWSNLEVTVYSPYQLWNSDFMADAVNIGGGTITATNAIFYQQLIDTNGNLVNALKITFGRVGNTFTMAGQTLYPPALAYPWSIVAGNYREINGTLNDTSSFEIILSDWITDNNYVDIPQMIPLTGTNNITEDAQSNLLNNIQISGSVAFTPPNVTITAPTAGLTVSSPSYTVAGKAGGTVPVTNVLYSLNQSAWTPTTNAGGWTNWFASVSLIVGTNTLAAYAVDANGNSSVTATVSFVYAVSAVLTVSTNGQGSLNPNDNGLMLQIGKNYSITATPVAGFAFTNWTGGTNLPLSFLTNGATLQFAMVTNLMLQANFIDTNKPVVSVTNVTTGMLVSNAYYLVRGTATDNVAVASVYCQLNGTGWTSPTSFIGTNWTDGVTLNPGTNQFQVYAVDTSGNFSATNTVSLVYVVSANLTVATNGVGLLTPNDNGALLQIGKNYSITASNLLGAGFAFTNWTGGTSLPFSFITNGMTVQFAMATNLSLQANFVDTNRPVLNITNVITGMQVSNANFVVRGTATDNVAVAQIYCQLNGTGWVTPTSFAGTNWTDQITLNPGTNQFQAYAVDPSGNLSPTNTVSLVYVVSATLTVSTNGLGSLNPNDSGALLQIGKNYSITAAPGTGFTFSNWTGGTALPLSYLTNSTTVQFSMVTNLQLQANFLDTNKPVLSITNLTAGQHVSNAVFTVQGTASDNWQVGNVTYQINTTGWSNAISGNSWSNWSAAVNLLPGTNTLAAYAVDTTGNRSGTNTLNFVYIVSAPLQIRITGLGTLSPNYSNAVLAIGQNYSITSAPASGFVFTNWLVSTNWIGGAAVTGTNLQFMMQSNLTLQANFLDVTKPTLVITAPAAGQHMTNALATFAGTAADNWSVSNVWYQLNNGAWNPASTTNGWTNWTTTAQLVAGTNTLKAYAVDLVGNLSTTSSLSVLSSNSFKLQLVFTNALPLTSTGLVFSLQLSTGLNGHIQSSSNLVNWTTLTNFIGTNSAITFRDPAATNSNHRYYRAVIP